MTKKAKTALISWAPVFIWMAVIFGLSSIPGKDIPDIGIEGLDKIAHMVEYGILGFLLIRAFLKSRNDPAGSNINLAGMIILSIIIASVYGITDEWHQGFVPGRTPDFLDLLADFAGLNIGIFLYRRKG